ncbi:MAG: hypothetical protein GY940_08205 [bacterium]|nr:hypothetical protein [bacterium]
MGLFAPLFIAAAGAAITHVFQQNSWKHNTENQKRDYEVKCATDLFQTLSKEMDKRLYAMRLVFWGIQSEKVSDQEVAERWTAYRKILVEWNNSLNIKLSMLERYFGHKMMEVFEFNIQAHFRELHSGLKDYYEKEVEGEEFEKKWEQTADKLSELTRKTNIQMIRLIQKGEVGSFHPDVKE